MEASEVGLVCNKHVFEIAGVLGVSEPVGSFTHYLAAFVALAFTPRLVRAARGLGWARAAVWVYVFGVVNLLLMSGTFHLLEPGSTASAVMRRLDHAGIWLLIAGSFTGIHALAFRGVWRWGVLLAVWIVAITGLVLKTVFFDSMPEALGLALYLGLGWVGVVSGWRLRKEYGSRELGLLLGGGLAYSVGAMIEFARAPVLIPHVLGPHELFHVGVLIGIALHWRLIEHIACVSHLRAPAASPPHRAAVRSPEFAASEAIR